MQTTVIEQQLKKKKQHRWRDPGAGSFFGSSSFYSALLSQRQKIFYTLQSRLYNYNVMFDDIPLND